MKDKEKQISKNKEINDLANTLYNRQDKYDLSNPFEVAKCVIDLGYRKLPKDSVVLTERELLDNCELNYDKGYKKGGKDTAEKILITTIQLSDMCRDFYEFQNRLVDLIETNYGVKIERKQIIPAKQFGVEIKE